MRVSISVPGTWHAFHLGRQLEARDSLQHIYTSYPATQVDKSGIGDEKVSSIIYPEGIMQLGNRIPSVNAVLSHLTNWNRPTERIKGILFDRAVARRLSVDAPDIFVGFAGSSLKSIQTANAAGCTTIVERCSSHIRTQAQLLKEEYRRFGYTHDPISLAHIEREEREYEIADYISVPSEFVYQSFCDHGLSEDRLLLEPYAVDIERFKASNKQRDKTKFLFAGGVGLRKGIPDLLAGWTAADLDNAELLIAGSVSDEVEKYMEKWASDDSVKFVGWQEDMVNLYQTSDVFVFPTIEEGSAYVTYEALASEIPLITTPNSGWVGEDGEHGIEIPVRSPKKLGQALKWMENNPDKRRRMGEQGRNLIESKYTWNKYGKRIHDRYKSIL